MNSEQSWRNYCEAEPLAYSGAIQPHGGLIYLESDFTILHVSAQIENFLGISVSELLDRSFIELGFIQLNLALQKLSPRLGSRQKLFAVTEISENSLDIVMTRSINGIVIELFKHFTQFASEEIVPEPIVTPKSDHQLQVLHEAMVCQFQTLIDFDRIMIYAFREGGDGKVLAEAHNKSIYGSYLGLRFPGSDIPMIARKLYLKNPWRLIPDSQIAPVLMVSHKNLVPDLTWSDLRSVSSIHQVYLANMGVNASLSFPIVVAGELWGLVACHHASPKVLPLDMLELCSTMVKTYSRAIFAWESESRSRFIGSLVKRFDEVEAILRKAPHLFDAINSIAPCLLQQFDACGLALSLEDTWVWVGLVPSSDQLEQLCSWFQLQKEAFYLVENFSRTHSDLGAMPIAGAIALKLKNVQNQNIQVWLFRKEMLQSFEWGGNPEKPVEFNDGEFGIAPRRSFEKWVEKRTGYCRPWHNEDSLAILRLLNVFLRIYGSRFR